MRDSVKKELARCCTASLGKVLKYGAVIFTTGIVVGVVINSLVVVKLTSKRKNKVGNSNECCDTAYSSDDVIDANYREVGEDDAI